MSSFHIVYHGPAIWVHSDYVRRTADDHTGARDFDAEVILAVNEHLASLFLEFYRELLVQKCRVLDVPARRVEVVGHPCVTLVAGLVTVSPQAVAFADESLGEPRYVQVWVASRYCHALTNLLLERYELPTEHHRLLV